MIGIVDSPAEELLELERYKQTFRSMQYYKFKKNKQNPNYATHKNNANTKSYQKPLPPRNF